MAENFVQIVDTAFNVTKPVFVSGNQDANSQYGNAKFNCVPYDLSTTNAVASEYTFDINDKKLYHFDRAYFVVEAYVKDVITGVATAANAYTTTTIIPTETLTKDVHFSISSSSKCVFDRATFSMNNIQVEEVGDADVAGYVHDLLYTAYGNGVSAKSSELFYPSEIDSHDLQYANFPYERVGITDAAGTASTTEFVINPLKSDYGALRRIQHFIASSDANPVAFKYVPPLGFFNGQNKAVVGDNIRITLRRSADSNILFGPALPATSVASTTGESEYWSSSLGNGTGGTTAQYAKFIIKHITLYVPFSIPAAPITNELELIAAKNTPINYQHVTFNVSSFSDSSATIRQDVGKFSMTPSHVFVCLQDNEARNHFTKSSGLFEVAGIKNIYLELGSRTIPMQQYTNLGTLTGGLISHIEDDVTTNNYNFATVFEELMQITGKTGNRADSGIVNYRTWRECYPIFGFNLSKHGGESPYLNNEPANIILNLVKAGTGWNRYFVICVFDCVTQVHDHGLVTKVFSAHTTGGIIL